MSYSHRSHPQRPAAGPRASFPVSSGLLLTVLLCLSSLGSPPAVTAAVFVVDTVLDFADANPGDGVCKINVFPNCTLRAAIMEANALSGEDVISIPEGIFYLQHFDGDLDITEDLIIFGAGLSTIIDGLANDRVFDVHAGAEVHFGSLVVRNGRAPATDPSGGGIRVSGIVHFFASTVRDSAAVYRGGGIFVDMGGILELELSVIRDNTASEGGGVSTEGIALLLESTVQGNDASSIGGGIFNHGPQSTVILDQSTISGNRAPFGGAVFSKDFFSTSFSTISGNITEDPSSYDLQLEFGAESEFETRGTIIDGDCSVPSTPVTSYGDNLESPGNTCGLLHSFDHTLVTKQSLALSPLVPLGGYNSVHLLEPGSFAIDRVVGSCLNGLDQRGYGRPLDGDGIGGATCDIGSVEVEFGESVTIFVDGFETGNLLNWN